MLALIEILVSSDDQHVLDTAAEGCDLSLEHPEPESFKGLDEFREEVRPIVAAQRCFYDELAVVIVVCIDSEFIGFSWQRAFFSDFGCLPLQLLDVLDDFC